jgi:hypothetical protein
MKEAFFFGYGDQLGDKQHRVNIQEAINHGLDTNHIRELEEKGFMTWIPIISPAYFVKMNPKMKTFSIKGYAISGFSGSPFVLEYKGNSYLFGVVTTSTDNIKKFNTEKEMNQFHSSKNGLGTTMKEVLNLIDKNHEKLHASVNISQNDLHSVQVNYENTEEMYFSKWDQ